MKRKIRKADGTIVEVALDYVLADGEQEVTEDQKQQTGPLGEVLTRDQVEALLNQARSEERKRMQQSLDHEKQKRIEYQRKLDELERQAKQRELDGMPPDARVQAQIADLTAQLGQVTQQLHATELTAYRERVLRQYGAQIIPEMVQGTNELEIDQSAQAAHQHWLNLRAQARQEVEAELRARTQPQTASSYSEPPSAPGVTPSHVPPGYVPHAVPTYVPPPNPAYNVPVPVVYPGQPVAGFPQPVYPQQVAPQQIVDTRELTTEEAVRSGRYSGEVRQQILNNLRMSSGAGYTQIGNTPRHMSGYTPQPVAHLPGGVTQPQGHPTGPAMTPNMPVMPTPAPAPSPAVTSYQVPVNVAQVGAQPQTHVQAPAPQQAHVAPQPAPQPQAAATNAAREAAQAAVNRLHAGQNPLLSQNPGAAQALADAKSTGQNPQVAFANRFSPTPPVTG